MLRNWCCDRIKQLTTAFDGVSLCVLLEMCKQRNYTDVAGHPMASPKRQKSLTSQALSNGFQCFRTSAFQTHVCRTAQERLVNASQHFAIASRMPRESPHIRLRAFEHSSNEPACRLNDRDLRLFRLEIVSCNNGVLSNTFACFRTPMIQNLWRIVHSDKFWSPIQICTNQASQVQYPLLGAMCPRLRVPGGSWFLAAS